MSGRRKNKAHSGGSKVPAKTNSSEPPVGFQILKRDSTTPSGPAPILHDRTSILTQAPTSVLISRSAQSHDSTHPFSGLALAQTHDKAPISGKRNKGRRDVPVSSGDICAEGAHMTIMKPRKDRIKNTATSSPTPTKILSGSPSRSPLPDTAGRDPAPTSAPIPYSIGRLQSPLAEPNCTSCFQLITDAYAVNQKISTAKMSRLGEMTQVIAVVGLPGSGKTMLAHHLVGSGLATPSSKALSGLANIPLPSDTEQLVADTKNSTPSSSTPQPTFLSSDKSGQLPAIGRPTRGVHVLCSDHGSLVLDCQGVLAKAPGDKSREMGSEVDAGVFLQAVQLMVFTTTVADTIVFVCSGTVSNPIFELLEVVESMVRQPSDARMSEDRGGPSFDSRDSRVQAHIGNPLPKLVFVVNSVDEHMFGSGATEQIRQDVIQRLKHSAFHRFSRDVEVHFLPRVSESTAWNVSIGRPSFACLLASITAAIRRCASRPLRIEWAQTEGEQNSHTTPQGPSDCVVHMCRVMGLQQWTHHAIRTWDLASRLPRLTALKKVMGV